MPAWRPSAGLPPDYTDIDLRVFCPLTYAQALLDHGFGHKDAGDGMTTTSVDTALRRSGGTDAARLGPE